MINATKYINRQICGTSTKSLGIYLDFWYSECKIVNSWVSVLFCPVHVKQLL